MADPIVSNGRARRDWCDDVPQVRQLFACHGEQHEIVWNRGQLGLVAHGTIDAERALRSFGGRAPACLCRIDEWMDALREPAFLEVWAKLERPERHRRQRYEQLWRDRVVRDDDALAPLAHLSDDMLDRLAFGVVCRALRGRAAPSLLDVIGRATAARVRRAFVRSLVTAGVRGGIAPLVPLECGFGEPVGVRGGVSSRRASGVEVIVRPSWILDVYARGLALTQGALVLDAEPASERGCYDAVVVSWDERAGALLARSERVRRRRELFQHV